MQVASALRDAAMGIDRFRVVQSPAPRFGGANCGSSRCLPGSCVWSSRCRRSGSWRGLL
jgi:hypothetical protein